MPRKSNGSSAGGGTGKHEKDSALPAWLEDIAIVNWEATCNFEWWQKLHKEIWLSDDPLWRVKARFALYLLSSNGLTENDDIGKRIALTEKGKEYLFSNK